MPTPRFDAVVFDLLSALLDSWTLWDRIAGSAEAGRRWRGTYLELTYRCGPYCSYETIIREAAAQSGVSGQAATALVESWRDLKPWPEAPIVLKRLSKKVRLGIATNASEALAQIAVAAVGEPFAAVATAEAAGFYKPRPEPYRLVLEKLGTRPERTLFVAGSAADIPGASGVGMPVYWHNRAGLKSLDENARPIMVADSLLPLIPLV